MTNLFQSIVSFAVIFFAVSVHESAHAWTANKFGDPTAKLMGRITLNPIAHIDWIGSIIVPGFMILMNFISGHPGPVFGWAKPVMVNPYNFRNPRRDGMLVSAAGPVSNLLVSGVTTLVFLILKNARLLASLPLITILLFLIIINIYLAVFNLIPIPPLDGSGILEGVLKGDSLRAYERIKPYGFFILLLVVYTHLLDYIANPILGLVMKILGLGA